MSFKFGTSLVPGAFHFGGSGLGVRGDLVPSEGSDGPGYLYPGLALPADAAKEVRGLITRWPSGALVVHENSSFTYTGATDHALYQLYVDGVASSIDIGYGAGIGRFDLSVGASTSGTLSGNVVAAAVSAGGSFSGAQPAQAAAAFSPARRARALSGAPRRPVQ